MPRSALPGTPAHQALLRHIIDAYATDDRVVAIAVFGSLARDTWDEWSDLDLDIATQPDAHIDAAAAAHALCETLRYSDALIVGANSEYVDVVLPSLEEFSIRYHPLGTTNAHIAADLQILAGCLDRAAVLAAGVIPSGPARSPETVVSEALRFSISVDTAIRRNKLWQALRHLDELRWRLEELFAVSRTSQRPAHAVDALASPALKAEFARTLAQADATSISNALEAALDLLENAALTDGHYALTGPQRTVLAALRRRTTM
jgi:predicted nucleotidyltransferase